MTSKMPGFFFVSMSGGTFRPLARMSCAGELHVGVGIVPLAQLVPVAERLVDHQLAVVAERDLHPLQRPGRGAFEVDAVLGVARAVAGAFELVLGAQPARRAARRWSRAYAPPRRAGSSSISRRRRPLRSRRDSRP